MTGDQGLSREREVGGGGKKPTRVDASTRLYRKGGQLVGSNLLKKVNSS